MSIDPDTALTATDIIRPPISVIIVSFNTKQMTLGCLRTLLENPEDVAFDVWVVDNASQDGSAAAIREAFPQVRVIESDRNLGFGAANNRAMEEAGGETFLLLNSDALVKPQALSHLLKYFNQHPEVGAVGPRTYNVDGSVQQSCFRFPSPMRMWLDSLIPSKILAKSERLTNYRKWAHDRERDVDWLIGACILVRRRAYADVGPFDPKYFFYFEETDWQRRMADQGWRRSFTPSAEVTHIGGGTVAIVKANTRQHYFDGLDRYQLKHHGPLGLVSLRLASICGNGARALAWTVLCLFTKQRAKARANVKFFSWVLWRQMTLRPKPLA